MSNLSLARRALLVKERFNMSSFTRWTLGKYYASHGVKFKRPDYTYWKSNAENQQLREKQLLFVRQLGSIIQQGAYDEIIYLDETTFHLWQKASRSWLRPGMKLNLLRYRGPSITVIGAISEARGLVHHQIIDSSNNAAKFRDFIEALKNKCAGRRVVLVLDNLRIHHARLLAESYHQSFKEMFLPPYSCVLNPIERLWSVLKHKWTQNMHLFNEELAELKKSQKIKAVKKQTLM